MPRQKTGLLHVIRTEVDKTVFLGKYTLSTGIASNAIAIMYKTQKHEVIWIGLP